MDAETDVAVIAAAEEEAETRHSGLRFIAERSCLSCSFQLLRLPCIVCRVVSIASACDSDSSGDKVTGSAKKSPLYFKFEYRDHSPLV